MNWEQRCKLIPTGTSTYSKMPCRHVEGVYAKTIQSARDAYVFTRDGLEVGYVDYELGLGAVVLGHANIHVNCAIREQLIDGGAVSYPVDAEAELAEKLHEIIPSAEMTRFVCTGSEATTAAVKIARAYTGRERIVRCGYHGWHPWASASTPHNAGCTADEKRQIQEFTYNDRSSVGELFNSGPRIAALIMEPYVFEPPKHDFLTYVRDVCTRNGAVLIFDEVVTGFRTPGWTAQKMLGVTPDLTCLGKCMSNGITPISAVCGRADLLKVLEDDCFVSSTYAANPIACKVALAVIAALETFGGIQSIWNYGERFMAAFRRIVASKALPGVEVVGYPCRTFFTFPTSLHRSLFWQECWKNKINFGYAQFISAAHTEAEMHKTVDALDRAVEILAQHWDDPGAVLEGKPAESTLRMVAKKPVYRCENDACELEFVAKPIMPKGGRYIKKPCCPACHRPVEVVYET